jgi:hypothetical protein
LPPSTSYKLIDRTTNKPENKNSNKIIYGTEILFRTTSIDLPSKNTIKYCQNIPKISSTQFF